MARLRLLPETNIEEEPLINMPAKENISLWKKESEKARTQTPEERFNETFPDREAPEKTGHPLEQTFNTMRKVYGKMGYDKAKTENLIDKVSAFKNEGQLAAYIKVMKAIADPSFTYDPRKLHKLEREYPLEKIVDYIGDKNPNPTEVNMLINHIKGKIRGELNPAEVEEDNKKESKSESKIPETAGAGLLVGTIGQNSVKALALPKVTQLALKAFPFVDLVAKTTLVGLAGLGGYGVGQVLRETPLATDPNMTYGRFYEELMTKGMTKVMTENNLTDRTKEALQNIVATEGEYKPTGFPETSQEKERLEGFPEAREGYEPEKILPREHILGKDVWRTPEGLTTVPPMIPIPTEEEIKGKKAGIGEELIPPEVPDLRLLKAKAIPTPEKPKKVPLDGKEVAKKGIVEPDIEQRLLEFGGIVGEDFIAYTATPEFKKAYKEKPEVKQAIEDIQREVKMVKQEIIDLRDIRKGAIESIQKQEKIQKATDRINAKTEKILSMEMPKGKVKPLVHLVTGKTKISNLIEIPEDVALKEQLKAEVKGAKEGFVAGRQARMKVEANRRERQNARLKVNAMLNDIRQIDTKHMRPEFAEKTKNIQEALDYTVPTKKTIGKLWSRKEYLEEYPDANLPDYALDELSRLEKMNRDDLTLEQLESLHMTALHAAHLSKYKNELMFKRVAKNAKEAIDEAVNNVVGQKKVKLSDLYDIDIEREEPRIGLLRSIFTVKSWNAELNSEILDKQENGIIKKLLYDNIDEGVTEGLRYKQNIEKQWAEWLQESKIDLSGWSKYFDKDKKKADLQILELPSGLTMRISKAQRVSIYMHSLNEKNRRHLLEGGYALEQDPTFLYKMSKQDLDTIINSMTEEEKQVAEALKNIVYDPQHGAINRVFVTLNGYPLGREENYLRIRVAGISLPKEVKAFHKHISQVALEEMGMTKERLNANNPIIVEDIFKATTESVKNASTLIGLAVPIRDAKTLLYSPEFETAVKQTFGSEWHKYFDTYLEDVVGSMVRMDDVEKLVSSAKDRLSVALLGLNPFVWAYQPVSYMAASTEIGSNHLVWASKIMATPELVKKWTDRSPQLLERIRGGFSRDVAEVGRIGEIRKFWLAKEGFDAKLMAGIRNFDTKTIIRICEACEHEQASLGYKGDELVVRSTKRAEEVIRKTQPTYHAKDRSEVSRSRNPFVRLLTMFTSQRNKNYNIQRRSIEKYSRSPKGPKDKAKMIWALLVTSIVQHNLIRAVKNIRRKILRKPEIKEKGTTKFVRDWLGGVLGNFYGGASFANSLASKIQRGTYAGYDMETPLSSLVGSGVDAIAEIIRSVEQFIANDRFKSGEKRHQTKWKYSLKRGLDKAAQVELTRRGIPYMVIRDMLKAGHGWIVNPETEKMTKRKGLRLLK